TKAKLVASEPRRKQVFLCGGAVRVSEDCAGFVFAVLEFWREHFSSKAHKECPPVLARFAQRVGEEMLDPQPGIAQSRHCFLHGGASLWSDGDIRVLFEVADGDVFQFVTGNLTEWNGRAHRISRIKSRYYPEYQFDIFHSASHRSDHAEQGEWASAFRPMARNGNASRSRLQAADTAEMRRHADRSTTIAADSTCAEHGRDR